MEESVRVDSDHRMKKNSVEREFEEEEVGEGVRNRFASEVGKVLRKGFDEKGKKMKRKGDGEDESESEDEHNHVRRQCNPLER